MYVDGCVVAALQSERSEKWERLRSRGAFSCQVASLELERKLTSGHSALQQKLVKRVCRGVLKRSVDEKRKERRRRRGAVKPFAKALASPLAARSEPARWLSEQSSRIC